MIPRRIVQKACVHDGCAGRVFASDLCRRHWQEWRDATAPECSVAGCHSVSRAVGMCNLHYQRKRRHGDPLWKPPTKEDRFWAKVTPTGFCWEWEGASDTAGYGVFNVGGRTDRAHRVSYELLIGPIPEGLHVDHLCRNRACCNPDHLEPVTARENTRRGEAPTIRAYRAGQCQRGHSMDDAYVRPDSGSRMCRTCARERRRTRANS